MSLVKSRELLKEIVGEDRFNEFELGLPIKVNDPNGDPYWIQKKPYGLLLMRLVNEKLDEGIIKTKDQGVYDSAASFLISGMLGKVDWKCGHINVDFPNEMPPVPPFPLSFFTYLNKEMKKGFIFLFSIPIKYFQWCIDAAKESYDEPWWWVYFASGFCFTFWAWSALSISLLSMNIITILNDPGSDSFIPFWFLGGFLIGGPIVTTITKYIGWREHWKIILKEVNQ